MTVRKATAYIAAVALATLIVDAITGRWTGYGIAVFVFLAARVTLAALNRPTPTVAPAGSHSFVVVIPVYNEDPALLARCVASVRASTIAPVEVIVVDDGSTEPVQTMQGVTLIRHDRNLGKREALARAFRRSFDVELYVTVDSDTVIQPDALAHLTSVFDDPHVHASTGQVVALNRARNLLTRLIDVRYTAAFEFERASQSALGAMMCCCGSLAAYRASTVRQHLDEFTSQTFLGRAVIFGDDRRMTAIALRHGRAVYTPAARAATAVPERFDHFLRQQVRWSKSWARETWLAIHEQDPRRAPFWVAAIEGTTWLAFTATLTLAVLSVAAGLAGRAALTYLAVASVVAIARSVPYLFRTDLSRRARAVGLALAPAYTAMHISLMLGVRLWALATIRRNGWGTRAAIETATAR